MGVLDQSPVTDPSKAKDPLHDLIRMFHLRLESSKMLMGARTKGFHQIPPPGVKDVASYGWTTYKRGGGARRWRTWWRTILTITNLHYQRAKPSPLWSRLCPGIRIRRGLARIAQILWGKASCGAGIACPPPRTARRGATREGEEVEGATPCFLPLVRHRGGGGGARQNPPPPLPFSGVAPSTVIPGGKAVVAVTKPRSEH